MTPQMSIELKVPARVQYGHLHHTFLPGQCCARESINVANNNAVATAIKSLGDCIPKTQFTFMPAFVSHKQILYSVSMTANNHSTEQVLLSWAFFFNVQGSDPGYLTPEVIERFKVIRVWGHDEESWRTGKNRDLS